MNIYKKLFNYIFKDEPLQIELRPEEVAKPKDPQQLIEAKKYHNMDEVSNRSLLIGLLGFDPSKTAWCAGFVNAIEKKCRREGTGKLAARSFLKYGAKVSEPVRGDIVIFKRGLAWQGHVGYYISTDEKGVLVLGGNQSNKVCYKYYKLKDVLGYRRP